MSNSKTTITTMFKNRKHGLQAMAFVDGKVVPIDLNLVNPNPDLMYKFMNIEFEVNKATGKYVATKATPSSTQEIEALCPIYILDSGFVAKVNLGGAQLQFHKTTGDLTISITQGTKTENISVSNPKEYFKDCLVYGDSRRIKSNFIPWLHSVGVEQNSVYAWMAVNYLLKRVITQLYSYMGRNKSITEEKPMAKALHEVFIDLNDEV